MALDHQLRAEAHSARGSPANVFYRITQAIAIVLGMMLAYSVFLNNLGAFSAP